MMPNGDHIEAKFPGVGQFKASGTNIILLVLIAALIAGFGAFSVVNWNLERDRDLMVKHERDAMLARERERAVDRATEHLAIVQALRESKEETNYILTLTEAERRALNLKMPGTLRTQQRERDR